MHTSEQGVGHVSMARLVVTAVVGEGRSKSEVARDYGVSRRWVQILVQRFVAEGEAGLEPRSRRPHRSPQRISEALEHEIVAIRKELDQLGHDNGPQTIGFHLERRVAQPPSVSTIWRVLTRRGFVTPEPHKRPKTPTSASRPISPTNAGSSTSPTGPSAMGPRSRS